MNAPENLQPRLREKAGELLARFGAAERATLLIKCWMSHDARWFMAVASAHGIAEANRLNQIAAHEVGKVEAQRVARALKLSPRTLDDFLLAQELFIALLGPDLLDYDVFKISDRAYQVRVRRCFAFDNAARGGIAGRYECGIFARVTGWFDAFSAQYEINPALGKCLKTQGQACVYVITLESNRGHG